jgi:phospholipid/cholesterol/gamma-HCH transport system ATP-binding protein
MIEIKNISKSFGDRKVIDDVSFTFEKGKTNLIIGESGSGKTTVMKLMVGLHEVIAAKFYMMEKIFQH